MPSSTAPATSFDSTRKMKRSLEFQTELGGPRLVVWLFTKLGLKIKVRVL